MSIQLTDLQVTIFECCYPVGSIYITESDGNPNTLIPGGQSSTWTKIENRMLIGSGSSYGLGSQGGEATHTLTASEMPSHTHSIGVSEDNSGNWAAAQVNSVIWKSGGIAPIGAGGGTGGVNGTFGDRGAQYYADWGFLQYTGSSTPHNNLPPYRAVNIWRRDS